MNFTKAARPVIMGQNGMVSAGHQLAAFTGVRILRQGGNAVDAALAAAFVMAVVKPEASGPGGDLFAQVYMKKKRQGRSAQFERPSPGQSRDRVFSRARAPKHTGCRSLKYCRTGSCGRVAGAS